MTLDLGPGRGFTSQSLAAVQIPVLVLGAGQNIDTQTAQRAFIAATNKELVPSGRASTFGDDAICSGCWRLYFSFMQLCKPSAAELIEEETPGESVVCRDAAGAKRQSIHRQVSDISLAFWPRHFPQNRWCGGNSRNRGFSCENRDSGVARYRIRQKWRSICYLLA
ncbi:hypothetical protein K9B32_14480 [Rhizobium sp. 3T7]|uniref:hypothetical protein n=1 Tax=Rhizobium sp. 3T7 TaxID=2874922 RepID=UPI001CCD8F66|nr:hypothetical protein [Rhizobium sp. 3T7]MBZ9791318.1 hypothetical protein [Rhizobium sp. 3T7]